MTISSIEETASGDVKSPAADAATAAGTATATDASYAVTLGVNTYSFVWSAPAMETVRQFKDLGFSEFEVMLSPPHLSVDDLSPSDRSSMAASLAASGITLRSMNLPSLDHNLASPMRRMREYSVQLFTDAIDLAADLGVTYVVVVPGRLNPLFTPPRDMREGWMRESLDPLVAHAERRGIKLALENIPIACFPDATSLGNFVRSYRSEVLSICYDAANAHYIGESPAAGMRELGNLISVIHLSDTTRKIWRHDEVGLGDVPFDNVLEGLRDIRFQGTCMMEIISQDDPLNAMVRSRSKLAALGYDLSEKVSL